ncbi:class I adenylate-forming enzyme family protein [Pseudonocardia xishanensis]|uniref:Long-chain fatty acid--CoA ligase n=1 Tax=Pseudonocardia xishanensis TaxID=630995 RepID=A0ABP8RZY6_9PSEU
MAITDFEGAHIGRYTSLAAHLYGERELVADRGVRLTFTAFHQWVEAVATWLVQQGVQPGDPVLIFSGNSAEVLAGQCAAWRIGAVPSPVVSAYRAHEIRQIVAALRPRVVMSTVVPIGSRRLHRELDECVSGAQQDPLRVLLDGEEPGWTRMPGPGTAVSGPDLPSAPDDPNATSLILYTSGSTSAPKGVRLTTTGLWQGLRLFEQRGLFDEHSVGLTVAPLSHVGGLVTSFLAPLVLGGRTVVMRLWDADEAVAHIAAERVTYIGASMTFISDILDKYESAPDGAYRLPTFTTGGASAPPALIKRADRLGIWGGRIFGMTETSGLASAPARDATLWDRAHLDGFPADSVQVRIVDEDGHELPPGSVGRILLNGPQLTIGYTSDEDNAQHFVDGNLDSGDVGCVDERGWLSITGRTKDIINRGGEKLPARDIEEALLGHPDVTGAAVIPIAHERLGEVPCAFVTTRLGTSVDTQEVQVFLRGRRLAAAKVPAEIHCVPSLPVSATGKVQKHVLATMREA